MRDLDGYQSDRVGVHAQVVRPLGLVDAVDGQHLEGADLAEGIGIKGRIALDAEDLVLALTEAIGSVGSRAIGRVNLEEGVQAATIDEDVLRVENAQAPGVADAWRAGLGVVGVVESRVQGVGLGLCIGLGHVVGRLSLDETSKDVLSVGELVLVESVVLDTVAPKPVVGRLDEQTTAGEDGSAGAVPVIKIVVGSLYVG